MIDKKDIISFFDKCAANWDAEMIRHEDVISIILDNACVTAGAHVLDVACGTGVLFDDYLSRSVASVTGVDISPEMASRAAAKFNDCRIKVLCSDIEDLKAEETGTFDVIMVYNAFPHFPDPEKLIKKLAGICRPGGHVSIAHGMSRDRIDAHHSGSASKVSRTLISIDELKDLMQPYFDINVAISDERMYQAVGTKR